MSMTQACHSCSEMLVLEPSSIGTTVRCANCHATVEVKAPLAKPVGPHKNLELELPDSTIGPTVEAEYVEEPPTIAQRRRGVPGQPEFEDDPLDEPPESWKSFRAAPDRPKRAKSPASPTGIVLVVCLGILLMVGSGVAALVYVLNEQDRQSIDRRKPTGIPDPGLRWVRVRPPESNCRFRLPGESWEQTRHSDLLRCEERRFGANSPELGGSFSVRHYRLLDASLRAMSFAKLAELIEQEYRDAHPDSKITPMECDYVQANVASKQFLVQLTTGSLKIARVIGHSNDIYLLEVHTSKQDDLDKVTTTFFDSFLVLDNSAPNPDKPVVAPNPELFELQADTGNFGGAAFSADGKRAFFLHPDGVRSRDGLDGADDTEAHIVTNASNNIVVANNGNLVLAIHDNELEIVKAGVTTKTGRQAKFVALSSDSKTVALTQDDGLRLYDFPEMTPRPRLPDAELVDGPVRFSPDGRLLVAGCLEATLQAWNLTTNKLLWIAEGHLNSIPLGVASQSVSNLIVGLAFLPGSDKVMSIGLSGPIRVWESTTGNHLSTILHSRPNSAFAYCPKTGMVALGSRDGKLFVFDIVKDQHRAFRSVADSTIHMLAFSPGGETLLVGSGKSLKALKVEPILQTPSGLTHQRHSNLARLPVTVLQQAGHCASPQLGNDRSSLSPRVAVSPDGKTVAYSGNSIHLRIANLETGEQIELARGNEGRTSLDYSPDGRYLATLAETPLASVVRLRHPTTGRILRSFLLGQRLRWANLAWSTTSESLIVSDPSLAFHVRIAEPVKVTPIPRTKLSGIFVLEEGTPPKFVPLPRTQEEPFPVGLRKPKAEMISAFSPNSGRFDPSTKFYFDGLHEPVRVYDVTTGELRRRLPGRSVLGIPPDSDIVLTRGASNTFRLWNRKTLEFIGEVFLSTTVSSVETSSISKDGSTFAFIGNRRLEVLRLDKDSPLIDRTKRAQPSQTFEGAPGSILQLEFTDDGKGLASLARFGRSSMARVALWNLPTSNRIPIKSAPPVSTSIWRTSMDPRGRWIATATTASITVRDVDSDDEPATYPNPSRSSSVVSFALEGDHLLACSGPEIRIWNLVTKKPGPRLKSEGRAVLFRLSEDAKTLVTLALRFERSRPILRRETWNLETKQVTRSKELNRLWTPGENALSPDAKTIARATVAGIELLDIETGKSTFLRVPTHSQSFHRVAYSPDGNRIYGLTNQGSLFVWQHEADSWKLTLSTRLELARTQGFAVSPDGKTLATGTADGVIHIWELSKLEPTTR